MKTSGLVAVLAGASAVDAFVPAPSASSALRQSRSTCVSAPIKAAVGARQSRVQQHYMVAAPAKEETLAAVPHGGTLVDLNLKTGDEKKVRSTAWCVWCAGLMLVEYCKRCSPELKFTTYHKQFSCNPETGAAG